MRLEQFVTKVIGFRVKIRQRTYFFKSRILAEARKNVLKIGLTCLCFYLDVYSFTCLLVNFSLAF